MHLFKDRCGSVQHQCRHEPEAHSGAVTGGGVEHTVDDATGIVNVAVDEVGKKGDQETGNTIRGSIGRY